MRKCMTSKCHSTVFIKRKAKHRCFTYLLLSSIQNILSAAQRAVMQFKQELLVKISH